MLRTLVTLLQKLVLPTAKSVGKSVWNGRYPQISHGFVPCVKTPWVNIFPRELPRALTIFPQILPWIIRGFNFPQISHKFSIIFNSHFSHISVVFLPQISNNFHTTISPTDFSRNFPRFLVAIFHTFPWFFCHSFPTIFTLQFLSRISHEISHGF
jgi:hypothetical protein